MLGTEDQDSGSSLILTPVEGSLAFTSLASIVDEFGRSRSDAKIIFTFRFLEPVCLQKAAAFSACSP